MSTPDPAPDTVHHIPLAEIDPKALPRDRTVLDAGDMEELKSSILASGLRMPIEIFPLETLRTPAEAPPVRYGLLSGYRRFHAFREMHEINVEVGLNPARFSAIPAFIRPRASLPDSLAAVVEENAIRADLSPWERGRIACEAWRRRIFATLDEAVEKLYPGADRKKRARLRMLAQVVEELDGILTDPEALNQRQLLRLGAALQAGFGDVIRDALEESSLHSAEAQWQLVLPYLLEAEQPPTQAPKRPDRPRRLYKPRATLTIRREKTRDGYVLHFTGDLATSGMIDDIFDDIERRFAPG